MKKYLILALAILAFSACQEGYVLTGKAGDLNGTAILTYALPDGTTCSDTTALTNGKFCFKGEVPETLPAVVTLTPDGGDPAKARLYLENCPIKMQINPDEVIDYGRYSGKLFSDVITTGGRSNAFEAATQEARKKVDELPEFQEYAAALNELSKIGYADREAYNAKNKEITEKFADVRIKYADKAREAINDCIAQFPDAEAAVSSYHLYARDKSLEEYEAGFNAFTEKVRNSFLAQDVRKELAGRKATQPGELAPDFTLNDPDGKPVTLSDLRGQYVIVDFWASWCKPCRAGMPGMKDLYAKYHDKGLEILGVSDDTKPEAWKQAIQEDQTPWIHVIDEFPEKNRPSRVGTLYNVHYIPSYFLVDKEGKIIGKMDHEELEAKLAELLP